MKNCVARAGTGAATVVVAAVLLQGCARKTVTTGEKMPLRDAFRDRFLVGAALSSAQFSGRDTLGAELVRAHFNSVTPEDVLKWDSVHPEPGVYDFDGPDRFVSFGETNGMFIVGHTLIWHNQTPRWVFEDDAGRLLNREQLLERMRDHIHTVVGRYKGRIKGWDVVNEAIVDDGSYNESLWLRIIGEEYVVRAFQFAREADPTAELYYNDFSVENSPKREGVKKLVKMLQAAGVTVDGIGIQGHYLMDWPTPGQLDSTIREFAGLGVQVMITELDVDMLPRPEGGGDAEVSRRFAYREEIDPYRNGLPAAKQQELAERYAELFRVFVRHSDRIGRVTFWGVDDGGSWLNGFPIAGRTNYPLLFDREGKPKLAFASVLKTVTE